MDLVTLPEVRQFIRLGTRALDADVDDHITMLANGAENWVARHLGVRWKAESRTEWLPGGFDMLEPAVLPVASVTSVTDTWLSNHLFETTDYVLRNNSIYLGPDGFAPGQWGGGEERFKVIYFGGYNNANQDNPTGSIAATDAHKSVVLSLVRRRYHTRGGSLNETGQGKNLGWDRLADGEIMSDLDSLRLRSRF